MKFFRAIAMILILVLASSPALPAICATSCASPSMMTSMHVNDMAGMKNCHEGSINKDQSKSKAEHKSCAMGASCHFTQVTPPMNSSSKPAFVDSATVSFPRFVLSTKSIDLSPPLKPPA